MINAINDKILLQELFDDDLKELFDNMTFNRLSYIRKIKMGPTF